LHPSVQRLIHGFRRKVFHFSAFVHKQKRGGVIDASGLNAHNPFRLFAASSIIDFLGSAESIQRLAPALA